MNKWAASSKVSLILNVIFLTFLLVPSNRNFYFFQMAVTAGLILFSFQMRKENLSAHLSVIKTLFFSWVGISIIYNLIAQTDFYTDSLIKVFYILILIVFFPICANYRISNKSIIIALFLILISQVSYILQISFVTDLIQTYYSDNFDSSSSEILASGYSSNFLNLRFGGIYRNPNQCGRVVTLLLAIYLINKNLKFKTYDLLFYLIFVTSILLTGSRTALLITLLLTASVSIFYFTRNRKKVIYLIPATLTLAIVTLLFVDIDFSLRIFDFSELSGTNRATNSSIGLKIEFLSDYITNTMNRQPLDLVFGTLNVDNGENFILNYYGLNNFDSEIGYIIHSLGAVGLLLLIWFYTTLFKITGPNVRLLMILFLWSFSSTVLTNMRFSFLFIFVLSIYMVKNTQVSLAK